MTSTKKTPAKLSFNLNLEDLDPDRYLPVEVPVEKCSPEYVETIQGFALLLLTADRIVDVCEALATHADDMGLHVPAGLFRNQAIYLRSTFVNEDTARLTTLLRGSAKISGPILRDAAQEIPILRAQISDRYNLALHLAETFGLDPDYISGGDEDEDEDEGDEDSETEDGDDD